MDHSDTHIPGTASAFVLLTFVFTVIAALAGLVAWAATLGVSFLLRTALGW